MVAECGEGEPPLPFALTAPRGFGGFCGKGPKPLVGSPKPGGPGPKPPPGDLAPQALEPGLPPSRGCVSNPWVGSQNARLPADLGGRWMVKFHERRGSRLRSSISAAGPGLKGLGTWPTSPFRQPSRVKNSKNAPVLIGS